MNPHRLTLSSLNQASAYLAKRGLPGSVNDFQSRLLEDRAALFWLCLEARKKIGPLMSWAVFAPREDPLPRIHAIQGEGIGWPLSRHQSLRRKIAFAGEALEHHGALWVPINIEQKTIDEAFGAGAWSDLIQTQCRERAGQLSGRLPGGPAAIARDRL